jgi:hypothetical protein
MAGMFCACAVDATATVIAIANAAVNSTFENLTLEIPPGRSVLVHGFADEK